MNLIFSQAFENLLEKGIKKKNNPNYKKVLSSKYNRMIYIPVDKDGKNTGEIIPSSTLKKLYNVEFEDSAKRIRQNETFDKFMTQFKIEMNNKYKFTGLTVTDFTEKELLRFWDFSRNASGKSFGLNKTMS